jgi:hypothetical protein
MHYYQYGPTPDNRTPHWYNFDYDGTPGTPDYGTGAVIQNVAQRGSGSFGGKPFYLVSATITLHFIDGKRGDDDLSANGSISFGNYRPVTISSANSATFTVGSAGSFTVMPSQSPPATVSMRGSLPTGVTFNPQAPATTNGVIAGVLSGTPAPGTAGVYPLTFIAHTGFGPDAVQNFTLTVDQAPAFTSSAGAAFSAAAGGTLRVTTSGFPVSSLSISGQPSFVGLTNTGRGDGTGLLVVAPRPGSGGTYTFTLTATNAAGSVSQTFTLTLNQPPAITSPNQVLFAAGSSATFTVQTAGYPLPSLSESGPLPAGITFNPANGQLTANLSASAGGVYPISFTATSSLGTVTQNFTLKVTVGFTSAPEVDFLFGTHTTTKTFTVRTTGLPLPALTVLTALPRGVSFVDNGNGTGTLSATFSAPAVAIDYVLIIAARNAVATVTQRFDLVVDSSPLIGAMVGEAAPRRTSSHHHYFRPRDSALTEWLRKEQENEVWLNYLEGLTWSRF